MRVNLSSLDIADDLFHDAGLAKHRSHVMFFGNDGGDNDSWRSLLNSSKQAQQYRGLGNLDSSHTGNVNKRYARLGVEVRNNHRNLIRIAPMKGIDFPEDLLSKNIGVVKGWIKNTLDHAKLNPVPTDFTIAIGLERPYDGDPFNVLRVKFDFDEGMWDDEVMWDIRYLLMGSKLGKLSGFPKELRCVQDKLYISRDGISERKRREGGN